MMIKPTHFMLTLGVVALISACDRPKPQAEVDREVAEKSSEVAKDMAEAKHDAIDEMTAARNDATEEIQEADRDTMQAQNELQQATADANYKLALEQASGERAPTARGEKALPALQVRTPWTARKTTCWRDPSVH